MSNETSFTPREIVSELDCYIVGQHDAKRAVAIALRNRWRRKRVPPPLRRLSFAARLQRFPPVPNRSRRRR